MERPLQRFFAVDGNSFHGRRTPPGQRQQESLLVKAFPTSARHLEQRNPRDAQARILTPPSSRNTREDCGEPFARLDPGLHDIIVIAMVLIDDLVSTLSFIDVDRVSEVSLSDAELMSISTQYRLNQAGAPPPNPPTTAKTNLSAFKACECR